MKPDPALCLQKDQWEAKHGEGAQRGSLVFSLRMLATARMWRSEDKLRELGQAGTRLLPHGSPRSNSVSRFGCKHLLILGTILSALRGLFFLIQIMIVLEGDRNSDTTSKDPSERSHYTNMSGSWSSCLSVLYPVSRVPTVGAGPLEYG